MHTIEFGKIDLSNIDEYADLTSPDRKHHEFNGPYFKQDTMEEHFVYIEKLKVKLENKEPNATDKCRLIIYNGEIVGCCSWYWRSVETNWLEIGIVIFDEENWSKGIGTKAFSMWIDFMFNERPEIVRIGFTTWSGNYGMVKVAEKLGLMEEARYRQARIVKGKYYDSVSYGILKEEWMNSFHSLCSLHD